MSEESQAALRNEATPLSRIDADERMEIGAGGTLGFESEQAELFRDEQAPCKLDEGSTEVLPLQSQDAHPSSTGDNDESSSSRGANPRGLQGDNSGENGAGSNRQDPRANHEGEEPSNDPADDRKHAVGGAVGIVVTVVRADGLVGTTPKSMFRTARRSKAQRRYVRVNLNLSCAREEKEVIASAVTPSVAGDGSECRWGGEESGGEDVFLPINPDVLEFFRDGEDESLAGTIEKHGVMDVEAWSDQSASGERDYMLGRGQIAVQDVKPAGGGGSQWVVLSLNGTPKGRVEVFLSETTTPPRATNGDTDQSGKTGEDKLLASNIGRGADGNSAEGEVSPKRDSGAEEDINGNDIVSTNETQDACDQGHSKSRSPKWGLSRMPHLKNTLNASLTRAARQGTTVPTKLTHTQPQENVSQTEEDDAFAAEEGSARNPLVTCEPERNDTSEKTSPGNNSRHGKQALFGARHGMQLLRESLHAKLAGTSGKTHLHCDSDQGETGEDGALREDGARCESAVAYPPARSGSTSLSRNDMPPNKDEPENSTMTGDNHSLAMYGEVGDGSTTEARVDSDGVKDGDRPDIVPPGIAGKEPTAHQTAHKDSLTEDGGPDDRRVNDRKANSPSPLKYLLRELGGRRRATTGGEDVQVDGSEGVDITADSSSDSATAKSGQLDDITASSASAPPVALAVKAAATRLKTTLSSPALAATLKGFGWNTPKEGGEGDASPTLAATGDPIDETFPSAFPHTSDVRELKAHYDDDAGLCSDSDIDPLSSPVATLLVTIFRADGLPENLAKGSFGRTKKDATQDPYVRLNVCGTARATSSVQGGGCNCRWGKKKAGELVELPLSSAKFREGRLRSLKLAVEVWNQESEGRDKDILLGQTEVVLGEWLGEKPDWVDLEVKRKRGGRVKLSVGLKAFKTEATANADASQRSPQQITGESCGTVATKQEPIADDASSTGETVDATRKSSVDNMFHSRSDVASRDGRIEAMGALTFAAIHSPADSLDVPCSSYGPSHNTDITNVCVPHLDLERGSSSSKLAQDEVLAEDAQRTLRSAVGSELDTTNTLSATEEGVGSGKHAVPDNGGGLRASNKDRNDAGDVVPTAPNVTYSKGDNEPKTSGIRPTVTPETVTIAVLVMKAQYLPGSLSETTFGIPQDNATQDLYCILSICGSKEVTSSLAEGGSASHREGAEGESVNLIVSHADLMAAGWGQLQGPHLTVEIWNQESASRQEDVFVGSADVPLKEYLGCGAKWVDLSRRRKSRGRVEILVSCPALQQVMLIDAANASIEPALPRTEQATLEGADTVEETGRTSSELPELKQSDEPVEEPGTDRGQPTRGNTASRSEQESGEGAYLERCGEATFNEAHDGVPDSTPRENEKPLATAEATPVSQSAGSESLLNNVDFVVCRSGVAQSRNESQESTAEKVGECVDKVREDKYATSDAGAHVGGIDENPFNPPEAAKASMGDNTSCLSRQSMSGTATALDVAASAAISDDVFHPSTQGQTITSDPLATTRPSRDLSSTTSESDKLQPFEAVCDFPSNPPPFKRRERSGDTDILSNGRISRRELPVADDDHTNGTQRSNSVRAGGQTCDEESGRSEPLCHKKPRGTGGQQCTTKLQVEASDKPVSMNLDVTVKAQRLERAREIARRRREMVPRLGPIGSCRTNQSSSDLHSIGLRISATSKQVRAVSTIQRTFRGRTARRHLRGRQRAAVKIQASFRGYAGRLQLLGLTTLAKRAKAEEQRSRARRARIASMQQELNLLRSTPALELLRIDALRATAMARRIQLFWRRHSGRARLRGARAHANTSPSRQSVMSAGKQTITAPEIRWYRSHRTQASGMALETLRQRVANRQRVKERSHWRGGHGTRSSQAAEQVWTKERHDNTNTGTTDSSYESLIEWKDHASRLTAAFHRSEPERIVAAKRRRQRLANFKTLQDQLLRPPTLAALEQTASNPGCPEYKAVDKQRQHCMSKTATNKRWSGAEEQTQKYRAQRAHALAAAAARAQSNKWWATSLPADVGYDEPVDIRRVLPTWPKSSMGRGKRLDYSDGFFPRRAGHTDDAGDGDGSGDSGGRDFNSDEASLWWYTYACTGSGDIPGSSKTGQHDNVFTELLERMKTSPAMRREHAERQEEKRRLNVERKSNDIVDKVNLRQKAARCPSLSFIRGRATAAQWSASVVLQACVRGFLERKKIAVLRAEMRVFGALQVLVNELRQPELDVEGSADPIQSLGVILAEHTGKTRAS